MEDRGSKEFRVRDLFSVPHFQNALLLGGEKGLDQPISRINVMEVPDVADWVRPGEFLMTTGYPFKHEPKLLVSLIAELARKGVVALGVKTKRFVETIPQEAVEAADHHGVPLIELPPSTSFSDAVREVMERVLVTESRDLAVLQGRVQRLSHVLLHGDGLPAFLNHLQAMIRNPIVLLEPDNGWTASADARQLCAAFTEQDWAAYRAKLRLESGAAPLGADGMRVHATAVLDEQMDAHLLLMFECDRQGGAVDTLTMNWAGRLLGLELRNMQARKKIEAKYLDQFMQDWVAGRIVALVDLRLRAEACGWELPDLGVYTVGVVSFRQGCPAVKELQELAVRLNRESAARRVEARWTVMEGELVVLLVSGQLPGDQEAGRYGHTVGLLAAVAVERDFVLCMGRDVKLRDQVPDSYRDAKRAASVREACRVAGDLIRYRDLGVYMLLYRLLGTEELEEYKRLYLKPLLELEGKPQGMLLNTLRTYFDCNCNVKETAERMFVHYNTIGYRLERIRNELGFRLDDPETKLLLQLAIKAHDIQR
ncbi:PucR family transcriptional regulator ligand-binding domain-containing protein [Paenibacillus athensensis]|uniref:PucR family transcriptional regulator n=1 Tax=Paenibacillus athensensis TaxID=1967502 RepID=A0A4Y8Q1T3_9BACL|nr:PucR family transcriptional regulator [Paenibacillus athensensis]MCD1258563.1 PucR family transcriptional regulator ligand-binding domain-containing protein [Paenibacillus athensensis]